MQEPIDVAYQLCKNASMSDWGDYRYFLAVARAASLSAAARAMRVDQSTVGRRLAALEAQIGARLFDHTPEGYVLTAAGEGARAEVERLELGFLAVERRLAGGDARVEGVVRLAISETFANMFLIRHLGALHAQHPGLSLELLTGNQAVDLARREADVALRLGRAPRQPNLVARRLAVAGFALYASPRYLACKGRPRLRSGFQGHRIVSYGAALAMVPIGRWLSEHAGDAETILRVDSVASAHQAVAAGLGLGVLPCTFEGQGVERVTTAVLGANPIWTVVHQDLVRNARVRAVRLFLEDLVHQERQTLAGK